MSATGQRPARIDALDIAKGILVLFMVLYHSLNYSVRYELAFRYLSFLPPSFILITGFLLTAVYLARHDIRDHRLHLRLLTRGTKLLVLFTGLNVAAQFLHSRHYHNPRMGLEQFFLAWPDVYLFGASRLAVFEILLPIAYLLIFAPVLLWIIQLHGVVLPALAAALLVACAVLENAGIHSVNFTLISAGVFGMLLGQASLARLNALSRGLPLALAAYGAYLALSVYWGQPFLLQLGGACIVLAAVYGISARIGSAGWVQQRLIRLGQYSLVAYIAQIGILQLVSHFAGRPEPVSLAMVAMFAATLVLTTAIIEVLAWSRARVPAVNDAYQAVFA